MEITDGAKEDARIILSGFYGTDFADRVVPRPTGVKPGFSWIVRQLRNMARRVIRNDGVYIMCKNEVARQYRTRIEQASLGF